MKGKISLFEPHSILCFFILQMFINRPAGAKCKYFFIHILVLIGNFFHPILESICIRAKWVSKVNTFSSFQTDPLYFDSSESIPFKETLKGLRRVVFKGEIIFQQLQNANNLRQSTTLKRTIELFILFYYCSKIISFLPPATMMGTRFFEPGST